MLVLIAPLAGAVLAPAFAEVPPQRRALVSIAAAAAIGGAGWAIVRSIDDGGIAWRGFALDPWRAFLACGALLCATAAIGRAESSPRVGALQAALFATTAAALASLAVTSSHLLAVTLPVGTAGLAVAVLASSRGGSFTLRGVRALVGLAASDVLVLVALGSTLAGGAALPPKLSTTSAAFLLAGALLRLGISPAAMPAAEASRSDPGLGLLWLGPVRAQGFLLVVMAIGSGSVGDGDGIASAAAVAATLSIVVAGFAGSGSGAESRAPLATGVAILGFALGGAPATWGAILAAAAAFAGPAMWAAGRGWSDTARAALGPLPAGGLVAGSALVVGAAFEAGSVEPWFFAFALPAAVGLLASVARIWTDRREPSRFGSGRRGLASLIAAGGGIGVALALAAVPEEAASGLGVPVARVLGTGRLLSVGGEPGVNEAVAALALAAAVVAFVVGPGRVGTGGSAARRTAHRFVIPLAWWAGVGGAPSTGSLEASRRAEREARRWAMIAGILFLASIGLGIRLYLAAAGRGFL